MLTQDRDTTIIHLQAGLTITPPLPDGDTVSPGLLLSHNGGSNRPGAEQRGAGAGLWVQGSRGHKIGDVLAKGKDTRLRVKGHLGGSLSG